MKTQEWLEQTLHNMRHFADPNYQYRIWVKGEMTDKYFDSFSESVCIMFDDLEIENFLKLYEKEQYCTKEQFSLLKRFHDLVDSYLAKTSTKIDPKILLADPEWHKIQLLAQEVLRAFSWETKIL